MDRTAAHLLYEVLGTDACLFGYAGTFPDEHTARLIELGTAVLEHQGVRVAERGRLSYVMVEAYQNVVRHRARLAPEVENGEGRSHFMLHCGAEGRTVATLNPVANDKAKDLQEVLGFLKGRNSEELKNLFRDGIQRTHSPERRGAGLGLIEMMRRSGATPNWRRMDKIPGHTLFSLAWSPGGTDTTNGLDLMKVQRNTMASAGAWLTFAGHCTSEVLEVLERMVEMEPAMPGQGLCAMEILGKAMALLGTAEAGSAPVVILVGNGPHGTWLQAGSVLQEGAQPMERIKQAQAEGHVADLLSSPVQDGAWVLMTMGPGGAK